MSCSDIINNKITELKDNLINLTSLLSQKQQDIEQLMADVRSCEQEISKINAQLPILYDLLELLNE